MVKDYSNMWKIIDSKFILLSVKKDILLGLETL